MRARKAALRDSPEKGNKSSIREKSASLASNGKKTSSSKTKNNKRSDITKRKIEEEEEKKREQERLEQLKIEEQNRHPDGPFSVPAGSNITHGMPVPIHCPADIDGPLEMPDDPVAEHSKVDNTTTHATIASGYDVLLGDFEDAFHTARRDGWNRVAPARRRRRFVDVFR